MDTSQSNFERLGAQGDLGHGAAVAEAQIHPLERLIHAHADELAESCERTERVTALCDLAEWAANAEFENLRPSVPVDDIRRALSAPAS